MADVEATQKRRTRPPAVSAKFVPRFWEELDNRYAVAKEVGRRIQALREDTGADRSTQRDMLAQRAVFISVMLETMEVDAVETGHLDTGSYVQAVNSLQGLLKTLGMDKKAVPVMDLQTYVAGKRDK